MPGATCGAHRAKPVAAWLAEIWGAEAHAIAISDCTRISHWPVKCHVHALPYVHAESTIPCQLGRIARTGRYVLGSPVINAEGRTYLYVYFDASRAKLVEAALAEMEGVEAEPRAEVARMLALQEAYLACPDAIDCCDLCAENGNDLSLYRVNLHDLACPDATDCCDLCAAIYHCTGSICITWHALMPLIAATSVQKTVTSFHSTGSSRTTWSICCFVSSHPRDAVICTNGDWCGIHGCAI